MVHKILRQVKQLPVVFTALTLFFPLSYGFAQAPSSNSTPSQVETPNFFDRSQRLPEPQLTGRTRLRFLTATDYPPFNFLDRDGRLTGFNVDLARTICEELNAGALCQIEARPFSELANALRIDDGDAIIAGLAVNADNRSRFAFTQPYLRFPARFVVGKTTDLASALDTGLPGIKIGVVENTAHEAMLRSFFPKAEVKAFDTRDHAFETLRSRSVQAVFGDGVGLSFWLSSDDSRDCCAFAGGPYLSDRFLGEGLAIAVRRSDRDLARAFDYAIGKMVEEGKMSELLLRYFPVSAF